MKVVRLQRYNYGSNVDVIAENIETGKRSWVRLDRWHKSYRPFTSPTEGTATTGGKK